MTFPIKRTPEQGHTKKCLANAMISAIQNLRDDEAMSDVAFRGYMQRNEALHAADDYLMDGVSECLCDPIIPLCADCIGATPAKKEIVEKTDSDAYAEKYCTAHFGDNLRAAQFKLENGEINSFEVFDI